jgi:rubrerythrin
MRKIDCLRCGAKMELMLRDSIQLGETGLLFRDLSHLLSGSLSVDIYVCPECRRLEFFSSDEASESNELPKKKCPACGAEHDFDYPRCPECKHDYYG